MENRITLYIDTFSFIIKFKNYEDFAYIANFCRTHLTTYNTNYDAKRRRYNRELDREFYIKNEEDLSFRLPIGILSYVMKELGLNGVSREDVLVLKTRSVKYEDIEKLSVNDISGMELRDYQQEYVDILTDLDRPNMLLIDMATGGGKGFCLAQSMLRLNLRTALLIIPTYIDKWVIEFKKYFDVEDDEIFVVQGSDSIRYLASLSKEEIKYKIFILSLRTITNFINDSLNGNTESYGITPDNFLSHLGVGLLASDETHQHFHAVYTSLLFLNTERLIAMSATLHSNNKDIQRMYDLIFPKHKKLSGIYNPENYVNVVAVNYELESLKGIRFKRQKGYNHNLYEQTIMKKRFFLTDYLDMIIYYLEKYYLRFRKEGDKALLFFASIDMCTYVTAQLRDKYKYLDVRRYVQDDPYENIINADISISTYGSAGVGLDIPNLITVIATHTTLSPQLNLQTLGRLRRIKDKELHFVYTYTNMISSQRNSNKERKSLYMEKAKEYLYESYPKKIRVI